MTFTEDRETFERQLSNHPWPARLMEHAGVDKDAVLFGFSNRIEIWSKQEYNKYMKQGADDFAALAEEVMGKLPNDSSGDVS